jgi:hypothetical protein
MCPRDIGLADARAVHLEDYRPGIASARKAPRLNACAVTVD